MLRWLGVKMLFLQVAVWWDVRSTIKYVFLMFGLCVCVLKCFVCLYNEWSAAAMAADAACWPRSYAPNAIVLLSFSGTVVNSFFFCSFVYTWCRRQTLRTCIRSSLFHCWMHCIWGLENVYWRFLLLFCLAVYTVRVFGLFFLRLTRGSADSQKFCLVNFNC